MLDAGHLGARRRFAYAAATLVGRLRRVPGDGRLRCGIVRVSAGTWIGVALLGGAMALARFLLDVAVSERRRRLPGGDARRQPQRHGRPRPARRRRRCTATR